jgi:hypothetical protein
MAKARYRYAPADASGPDYPQLGATVAKWREAGRAAEGGSMSTPSVCRRVIASG